MNRRHGKRWGYAIAVIPAAFLGVAFCIPVAAALGRAVSDNRVFDSELAPALLKAAAITLGLASAGTAIAVALGVGASLALNRRAWRGAAFFEAFLSAPFVFPTIVVALAYLTLGRTTAPWLLNSDGVPAIAAALAFFNIGLVVRLVGPSLKGMSEQYVYAARTLGASRLRIYTHVIWPTIRRNVVVAAMTVFIFCATSLAIVLTLGASRVTTLEVLAYREVTTYLNLSGAAVAALVQASVLLALVGITWALTRQDKPVNVGADTRSALKSFKDTALVVAALSPSVTLIAAPVATLVYQALHGLTWDGLTRWWKGSGPSPGASEALLQSLGIGSIAALIALVVATSILVASELNPQLKALKALGTLPLAVSPVLIGVGVLIGLAIPMRDLGFGPYVLLVVVQAVIALPLVLRALGPTVQSFNRTQLHAATTLGASPQRALLQVALPAVAPALSSAAGLAFAVAIGEFGASTFLARPDAPTLPTAIARSLGRPGAESLQQAALSALLLACLCGLAITLGDYVSRKVQR